MTPAEAAALRAENERLRALLQRAVSACDGFALPQALFDEANAALAPPAAQHDTPAPSGWDTMENVR